MTNNRPIHKGVKDLKRKGKENKFFSEINGHMLSFILNNASQ